jgi:hypothetical protein
MATTCWLSAADYSVKFPAILNSNGFQPFFKAKGHILIIKKLAGRIYNFNIFILFYSGRK